MNFKKSNILVVAFIGACALGLSGCGDVNSNKTTTVKKETKTDGYGNERTKVETKTVETTDTAPNRDGNTTVRIIEEKKDPIIKVGPLEIK